jgi:hypothetical protein
LTTRVIAAQVYEPSVAPPRAAFCAQGRTAKLPKIKQ